MEELERFVDEQGSDLNAYKLIKGDGSIENIKLLRNANITQVGTPLNAERLNKMVDRINSTYSKTETDTQINALIKKYMTTNYENGNKGAY